MKKSNLKICHMAESVAKNLQSKPKREMEEVGRVYSGVDGKEVVFMGFVDDNETARDVIVDENPE